MTAMAVERNHKARHHFVWNKGDNGGEALILDTYLREDGSICQRLCLNSYCNTATIGLGASQITPRALREAANRMDSKWAQIAARAAKEKFSPEQMIDSMSIKLSGVGDPLTLEVEYVDNGDSSHGLPVGVYTNQRLIFGPCWFTLSGASVDAPILRNLANELDTFFNANCIKSRDT